MKEWFEQFLLAFIPLFIAIDPVGLIPLFLTITRGYTGDMLRRVPYQATLTAAAVALGFMFLGKIVFEFLGITVQDFQVAGGLILFALAAKDLVGSHGQSDVAMRDDIGVVPLGTPIIAGPALITTLLFLVDTVGILHTLLALTANLILVALAFRFERLIGRIVGVQGLRALSKIVSLLLAAIAVHMIRLGVAPG